MWGALIQIAAFIIIGFQIFSVAVMPMLTAAVTTVDEPLSALDCVENYANLWISITTMEPFLLSAPKDSRTNLLKDPCEYNEKLKMEICQTWFRGVKSDFKNKVGESFIQGLEKTFYLERHTECRGNNCPHLENCLAKGKTAIDPEDTTIDMQEENDVILDCLQVANYMIRRNIYLEEQATTTMSTLTDTWMEAPP